MTGIQVSSAPLPVPFVLDPVVMNNGLLGENFDAAMIGGNVTPSAATIQLAMIPIPKSLTITNLLIGIGVAGTNYTNAQLGLYSSAGVLLSQTAILASGGTNTYGTTGIKEIALAAPQAIVGGPTQFVWVAHHEGTNAATAIQFFQFSGVAAGINAKCTAATARYAHQTGSVGNSLQTIGNLTPASNNMVTTSNIIWMGIS